MNTLFNSSRIELKKKKKELVILGIKKTLDKYFNNRIKEYFLLW